jgi:sec-independent protein translocase protein TatC
MSKPKSSPPTATRLLDHIRELQKRLLICFATLTASGIATYFFYQPILTILRTPLNAPLYYSSPAGNFCLIMKICFMGAITATMPVIVYNLASFVRPAFEKSLSTKRVLYTTALSALLAILGAIFAFTCVLPGSLQFFSGFQVNGLNALISADNYLKFVTNIIIIFVIIFQLPLVISFIDRIKPLQPQKLFKMEKWIILGSLIVALLTPFTYDLVTSLLIAVPIVALYNLSIVMILVRHRMVSRKSDRLTKKEITLQQESASMPTLDDQTYASLADELAELEKIRPVTIQRGIAMDIKQSNIRQKQIAPSALIQEEKTKPITFETNRHIHVFSE